MDFSDAVASGRVQRVFRAREKVTEPGFISHITQRAAGKEPLFLEEIDYLTMLGLLKESAEKFNLRYYALCLMPNHVHLLIEPQERNLAEAMRSIFSRYAAKFNNKYERRGHLFGEPYRQSVCLDSTYLLTASVYIHLNPVRADLINESNSYRWSSSAVYCQQTPRESFVDPQPVLRLVHEDGATARRKYKQLMLGVQGAEPDNALEQEGAVERFCMQLSRMFPQLFNRLAGQTDEGNPGLLGITELERRLRELNRNGSRAPESRRAKKYVVEQLLARGYKKTEIAGRLGVARKTVYNILSLKDA